MNKTVQDASKRRPFFQWLNIIFNSVDRERIKLLGPDRVCAEWILRNGGAVKWLGAEKYQTDYNTLPPEEVKFKLSEIDASDSSISHHGFAHFIDCEQIHRVILHNCSYLEDEALKQLHLLKRSLMELQVSECGNISDNGIRYLKNLT